jgi:hypothetical protein
MNGAPVFWATTVSGSEQVNLQQTGREDCFLAMRKFGRVCLKKQAEKETA